MNYHKIFKDAYSAVSLQTSDESFAKSVAERKNDMESRKKISIKKPVIAICAAAVALTLGTVGAAAAGLINFNEIFGNTIRTDNAELGEALIGNAENVKWTVSDEDYVVNLKGVTGSNSEMVAVIEIARADGQPVKDYLSSLDFLYEGGFLTAFESVKLNGGFDDMGGGGCSVVLNEAGNIEVSFERLQTGLAGTEFELNCMGFYPAEEINELIFEDMFAQNGMFGSSHEYYLSDTEKEALNKIELLDLSWSLEFTYAPSETGENAIAAENFDETVKLDFTIRSYENYSETDYTTEAFDVAVDKITADSMGFEIGMMVNRNEYPVAEYSVDPDIDSWNIEVICKDGTEIPTFISRWNGGGGDEWELQMSVEYYDDERMAVDLSEISAISINGTVYNLE